MSINLLDFDENIIEIILTYYKIFDNTYNTVDEFFKIFLITKQIGFEYLRIETIFNITDYKFMYDWHFWEIEFKMTLKFLDHCMNLEYINLNFSNHMYLPSLINILTNNKNLSKIDIYHHEECSDTEPCENTNVYRNDYICQICKIYNKNIQLVNGCKI